MRGRYDPFIHAALAAREADPSGVRLRSEPPADDDGIAPTGVEDDSGEWAAAEPQSPAFLVVEDEPRLARVLGDLLAPLGDVSVAYTFAGGLTATSARRDWTAHFIDLGLPDGNGLDLIEAIRTLGVRVPSLVVTGDARPAFINRIHDLGVDIICKPVDKAQVTRFAVKAAAAQRKWATALGHVVTAWAHRYTLAVPEARILRSRLRGTPRQPGRAAVVGVTGGLMSKTVQILLAKTGDPSLEVAVQRAFREALASLA